MTKLKLGLCAVLSIWLTACAVKSPITNQYKIKEFAKQRMANHTAHSIFVSQPEAMAGYQTEQMLYTAKPFEINAFAHNSWISAPANMLYPLITQSLQQSHYFAVVAAGPNVDKTDYRLDTQVLALQQNFLTKPSKIELVVQTVVTHVPDNRVLASKTFTICVPCMSDTPYGGVVAANKAAIRLTQKITEFVVRVIG